MESTLHTHLLTLETSLATLTRSISTLTPSASAPSTLTLISTFHSLTSSLASLATHQSNVTRISDLQFASTALDVQLQSQLSALAELRAAIKAAELSRPAPGARAVESEKVVEFGRHFARAGPPKGWRGPSALKAAAAAEAEAEAEGQGANGAEQQAGATGAQPTPSGSATPALNLPRTAAASPEGTTPAANDTTMPDADPQDPTKNTAYAGLSENDGAWLHADAGYVPWVLQETMEKSALRQYQGDPVQGLELWKRELEGAREAELEKVRRVERAREEEERRRGAAMQQREMPAARNILDD